MKASILIRDMVAKSGSPALASRAREKLLAYFEHVRAVPFGAQWVFDSAFPPFPGKPFSRLVAGLGHAEQGKHQSSMVTIAVTNRCMLDCWHCYNAGRDRTDLPLEAFRRVAGELLDLGAARVSLTGGEPLLRDDIEEICQCFDDRCCLAVSTTGLGLTSSKARGLKRAGLFALGVSLDSDLPAEHDRLRGREGMFDVARRALATAREAGLFPYVLTMARPELIARERFMQLLEVAGRAGALEVVILEPVPVGNMAGRSDVSLTQSQRGRLLEYQREVSFREDLPLLSTSTYLGSSAGFGCSAGLGHIYIDGSGEICPCNMVPLSFGNVMKVSVGTAIERMHRHFRHPRTVCVGRVLGPHIPEGVLPTPPDISEQLCREYLAVRHDCPGLYESVSAAQPCQAHAESGGGEEAECLT
jgi:MoaA/NifB/PqqE/SkfB family radical SAM enzyme